MYVIVLSLLACAGKGDPKGRNVVTEAQAELPAGLYINEVLARNDTVNTTQAGHYADWVEIYNGGEEEVSLEGVYLTTGRALVGISGFPPDAALGPGDFTLVWCDGMGSTDNEDHAPFALDKDGDSVSLLYIFNVSINPDVDYQATVTVLDEVYWQSMGADISASRWPDGAENWVFATPTPGAPNREM